jgi:RNA polymerase sigma-70 factor, ECF subfamily
MHAIPDDAIVLRDHGPRVWALCRRLAREPEDAYQEIWEKVLRALPRFDPHGTASLRTWISTIAHRHLVDVHRRARVRGPVLEAVEPAVHDAPGEALDVHRRRAALDRALRRLPEAQRQAVLMHHLGGLDIATVAQSEGVAPGTIKSRLHRARARLVELLEAP